MKTCKPASVSALTVSAENLQQETELASMAKALSHPARVRILVILNTLDHAGSCVNSDFVAELNLAQSTVSEHLRILKQAGLIHVEPQLPKMCYRINREQLQTFSALFQSVCCA